MDDNIQQTDIMKLTNRRIERMRKFVEMIQEEIADIQPWEFTAGNLAKEMGLTRGNAREHLKKYINNGTIKVRIGKQSRRFYSLVEKEEEK